MPAIVIADVPDVAPFCELKKVSTGESYVTAASRVAWESLMRTLTVFWAPVPSCGLHVSAVCEVHAEVAQTVEPKKIEAVRSPKPKLVPVRVIVSPTAAVGMFWVAITVIMGESYVHLCVVRVPTKLATVISTKCESPAPLAVRQVMLVGVNQEVVAHVDEPISLVAEKSRLPKLDPDSVRRVEPETAPFAGTKLVTTGASKLNAAPNEPIRSKTRTETLCWLPAAGLVVHTRLLSVVHEAVAQAAPPVRAVSVLSTDAKFRPEIVRPWFALKGPFNRVVDVTTGALYEKERSDVETTDWIVNNTDCVPALEPAARQATVLAVVQETVLQPIDEPVIETLPVRSTYPKFRPRRVMLAIEVAGRFGVEIAVTAGESKENEACLVPAAEETRTKAGRATPFAACGVQTRAVSVVHDVVVQYVEPMAADGVRSTVAKLTPITVSEVVLDCGAFARCRSVMTGPSKENTATSDPVASTFATICTPRLEPKPDAALHTLEVVVIHCVAEQAEDPIRAVIE